MNENNPLDAIEIVEPSLVAYREERVARFERTLSNVAPLVPEEEDPNVLFRNNWLARGQAVQLVATSGVGKSSMTIQTAINWAAGIKWLAEPMRPLKCAIIQAEDSERDVAEQIEGMRWGFTTLHGWTDAQFNEILKRILCPVCFIGLQGDAFISTLREFQAFNKCDMLFINPVQAFFGGDVSDQESVSQWTRGGIDPIIKDEQHACGALVVCHTTKFTSGDKTGRANVEDYGEYIGAGSHEWLDWVRAKFVFLKHGKSEDYFDFKAAKRGKRLGWKDGNGNATTKKVFKHSEGHIFWQEVTDEAELSSIADVRTESRGRREKDPFDAKKCALQMAVTLAQANGVKAKSPHCKNQMVEDVYSAIRPIGRTRADAKLTVMAIWEDPSDFGVEVVKHPKFDGETLAVREDF